ncbi:MAG: VanW family protein [Clostridia bacterium]|nr:VanW family protein [Clostridia bacterium]MDD4375690.1 VanW family protein [Clostridia bacterium]
MKDFNFKGFLLILLIFIVLGGFIFVMFSSTSSPIKNLRSNTIQNDSEHASYIDKNKNTVSSKDIQNSNQIISDINKNNSSSISDDGINITENTTMHIEASEEVEIAKYSTTIYDKEENRIYNIKKAIGILDGKILESGKTFSFNDTIGPMGEKEGFKKATGFNGNAKKIKISAGGICQISSTLYNVALISKFEIVERHPHSKRVYYVPKNKDATILYGGADLKFKNTSNNDIKISALTDGHEVTIKFLKIV